MLSVFQNQTSCLVLMITEGNTVVWTSPMLKKLQELKDNPLGRRITENESSWLAAIPILGGLSGALICGSVSHTMGRKPLLLILSIPSFIFFLTMAFAKSFWLYLLARFMSGFGFGGICTVLPIYICELADPKVRGRLCFGIPICMNIGSLITYCTGPYMSFFLYHISLSSLPLLFVIFFYIFALESPYYYLQTDLIRTEQILKELRGKTNISEEITEMQRGLKETSGGRLMAIFETRSTRRGLVIGIGLAFFTMFTGSLVIATYAQFIFDKSGGDWSGEADTIVLGTVQVVVVILASSIKDKFGRKPLYILSYAGIALSFTSLGTYFILKDNAIDMERFGWLPLISLVGYFVTQSLGVGPMSQTVTGELFPLKVKSEAIAICTSVGAVAGFVTTFYFMKVTKAIGMGQTFWIFAGCGICASVFIKLFMVETRGRTLEQVQDALNGIEPDMKMHGRDT